MADPMSYLHEWDNFYLTTGAAAGAIIGLQFVVMTLIAERPPRRPGQAGAAYSTPTVFHFAVVLFLSILLAAPWRLISTPAPIWGAIGIFGVGYAIVIARRIHSLEDYRPVAADWLFNVLAPIVAYGCLTASAVIVRSDIREALYVVAVSALLLLFTGIRNSWDLVGYHVSVSGTRAKAKKDQSGQ